MTATIQDLLELLPPSVVDVFADIETAEREVEAACQAAPLHLRPLLFGSFQLLCPQMKMPALLYAGHCRELLRRVECGGDVDAPTAAEVATVMYELSLIAPMQRRFVGAYLRVVQAVSPAAYRRAMLGESPFTPQEDYPGQFAEVEADVVRHVAKVLRPRGAPSPLSPTGRRREQMAADGIIFPKEGDMHPLYTIGYAGLKAVDLQAWAAVHGALVIDTRMNAYSPRPEWRKPSLSKLLGDGYRHLQELGNVNYKTGGEIVLKDAAAGYRTVLEALAVRPVVLLCGCADLATCHRFYIANRLEASTGAPAVHLTPEQVRGAADSVAGPSIDDEPRPSGPDTDVLTQRGLFGKADDIVLDPTSQLKLL